MADFTTPTPVSPQSSSDREAAIEQLLLAGLDHYFAGRLEQAIHLWTRILFLDRGHVRARAYIERARLAVAEGERALEERQWTGATAAVVARPAMPPTDAPTFESLDRIQPTVGRASESAERIASGRVTESVWPHVALTVVSLVLLCAAAFIASEGDTVSRWMLASPSESSAAEPVNIAEPLPVPDTSRMLVERARALFTRGHVREALDVLEAIRFNDVAKSEADALRGELQRALLDAGGFPSAGGGAKAITR